MDQKRKKRVLRLIEKLSSQSENEIFNSLLEIRKNVLKSKEGISSLSEFGGISKTIQVLARDAVSTKTLDITLSILGNLCMDSDARKVVKRANGIEYVAHVFENSKEESIQNRSSRTLANLALDHENIGSILKTNALEKLASVLQISKIKENILTYSRTARLLAKNVRQLEKLISENIVLHLAKHLKDSDEDVKFSVLRSVFELCSISCSAGFASQIVSAGVLSELLSLVTHDNDTVIHQSVTLLQRLSTQPSFRPGLGSAGGIVIILNLFQDEENLIDKNVLLSILCDFCRESVNRIKIRDNDILQVFLSCLNDEKYSSLHNKLISALQCFVYDETSMSLLLDNGLIGILVNHLQRAANFQSVVCSAMELIPTFINDDEMAKEMSDDQNVFHRLYELPTPKIRHGGSMALFEKESVAEEEVVENIEEQKSKELVASSHRTVVYSIDSPTYVSHSNWDFDQYTKGDKCKQFLKSDFEASYSSSPLSTVSFHSPKSITSGDESICSRDRYTSSPTNFSFSSPGCSSWSGNESSPEHSFTKSTVNKDPNYGMVCSMPYTCDSPIKRESPMELSPMSSPVSYLQGEEEFSSCESEEELETTIDDSKNVVSVKKDKNPNSPSHISVTLEMTINKSLDLNEIKISDDTSNAKTQSIIEFSNLESQDKKIKDKEMESVKTESEILEVKSLKSKRMNDEGSTSDTEPSTKRQKLSPSNPNNKTSKREYETENQILILLSQVSQINDPSFYLVTMEVICCLLDYLDKVHHPLERAARILSRLAKNPFCFQKLLKIRFVLLVYYKLSLYKHKEKIFELAQSGNCILQKSKVKQQNIQRRRSSNEFSGQSDNDYSFFYDDNSGKSDLANNENNAKGSPKNVDTIQQKFEQESHFKAKVGLTLLQDMCIQADSHFGRGEVSHLLHRYPDTMAKWLHADLIYVLWLKGMQNYYFKKLMFLDKNLGLLERESTETALYQAALQGLAFLGKIVSFPMEGDSGQPEDDFHVFQSDGTGVGDIEDTSQKDMEEETEKDCCKYLKIQVEEKVEFEIEGQKLACCRNILSMSSPLFTAMLHGKFLEANQDEVVIEDTTFYAFQYLIHYLHGCTLECTIIRDFLQCDISSENVNQCLEVFSLAIKYMVGGLQTFLLSVLSKRLMTAETSCHIFHFALLHDFPDLADESVVCVTKRGDNLERMKGLYKFLNGPNRESFLITLRDLFCS